MSENNNSLPRSELDSSAYLLKRFDADMLAVHRQMEVLQIVFDNLKGSWIAINQAYKVFKIKDEEKS